MNAPETPDGTSTSESSPTPSEDDPDQSGPPGRRPEKKDMHTEGSTPPPEN